MMLDIGKLENTRESFMEHFEDVSLVFDRYYKYTFTFKAVIPTPENTYILYLDVGGVSDYIYKMEVISEFSKNYAALDGYAARLHNTANREIVAEFNDW